MEKPEDRPGWSFDCAAEEWAGPSADTVVGSLEGTNFGVRSDADEWRICEVREVDGQLQMEVEEELFSNGLDAMLEVERRAQGSS